MEARVRTDSQENPHRRPAAADDPRRELEQLIAALPTILIGLSAERRVKRWNPLAEKVLGLAAADVLGRPLAECPVGWQWSKVADGLARCAETGEPVRLDGVPFTAPDGREGLLGITVTPAAGGYLLLGADITERQRIMQQLNQAQKLKSIGRLAAGIAHEINTPTQYVGDNTRFLQEAFEDLKRVLEAYGRLLDAARQGRVTGDLVGEVEGRLQEADLDYLVVEIPDAIAHTLEGITRISKIVRAMKEFSHPGREEKVPTDINQAIESTVTVARNEWKYVAELTTELDPELPLVPCLPAELNQVILNMIINAAQAIADTPAAARGELGRIHIATARAGEMVQISVSDTGIGIPEEVRPRIFDPFFTTKEVGRGTGQGLAICYPVIVEKHGGSIDVRSEVGRGTEFVIRLPLTPPEEAHADR